MSSISLGISSTTNVVTLVFEPQNTLSISTAGSVTPTSVLDLTDVDASSITNGQVLVFDSGTGTFIPGDAAGSDTNIGNTDQTLTGARDVELDGNNLTFSQGDVVRHTISPTLGATFFRGVFIDGDNSDGGKLSLREASPNGTSIFSFSAPASLASNVEFILPSADGSDGHFLKTDGSGNLSFAAPSGLNNVVEDTSPQLGGHLDAQANNITNLGRINGTDASTIISGAAAGATALQDVVDDTTPQLGGALDTNGNAIQFRDTGNTNYVELKAFATDPASNVTFYLPIADGTAGQVLGTNGSGKLSFTTVTSATGNELENVVEDTTPQLGGNLDAQSNNITNLGSLNGTAASKIISRSLTVACSDETSDLTTGTAKATFRMPEAATITGVRASVTTAPAGSVLTVDINEAGTSILSTKLTIDAGEKTSTTAATAVVISDTSVADDAEMTVDIDGVGSSTAGAGLKVTIYYTPA